MIPQEMETMRSTNFFGTAVAGLLRAAVLGLLVAWLPAAATVAAEEPDARRPNVLFIAIDDLNDWVGCLEGHPQVQTPHIDRLAERGVLFSNAHCQSPLCNPSRTSILVGLRPSTTGIYGLAPWFRTVEELRDLVSLPQHFGRHGYRTLSTGKIWHGGHPPRDALHRESDEWGPWGGIGARPAEKLIPPTPMGNHPLMDWGIHPEDNDDSVRGDYQVAGWAVEQLERFGRGDDEEPFFLAVGFFLPHVPCYASPQWFELYPEEMLVLPPVKPDDRDDVPRFADYLHWYLPEPRLRWLQENDQWLPLVRAYLATISFVDAQVGRVVDALEAQGLAENTVIVLWSDHGFHLGEKGITGKNTLWERSARVPLIFAGPGVTAGGVCSSPAELLDIFPTLIELCGLEPLDHLEGRSLGPQLRDPAAPREHPAITTHNQGNHGIRSARWRYIRYADGSEELYDMEADPNEWTNLAGDADYAEVLAEHRRWLPAIDLPPAPGSAHRVLTYDPETGEVVWEGEPIDTTQPLPES